MTPPDAPTHIGELADQAGLNTKTIRYYESIGLLPEPVRTPSGHRTYPPGEVGRPVFIRSAQRLGLSLDEIREVLAFRDRGDPPRRAQRPPRRSPHRGRSNGDRVLQPDRTPHRQATPTSTKALVTGRTDMTRRLDLAVR